MKLPKSMTFGHRLFKVEPQVALARAIGVKDDECTFRIGGFYEIAEEHDFWTPFTHKKRAQQNRFLVLLCSLIYLFS
ncbi:hypothetical protein ABH902_003117 [Enterococcus sp. UD-01]